MVWPRAAKTNLPPRQSPTSTGTTTKRDRFVEPLLHRQLLPGTRARLVIGGRHRDRLARLPFESVAPDRFGPIDFDAFHGRSSRPPGRQSARLHRFGPTRRAASRLPPRRRAVLYLHARGRPASPSPRRRPTPTPWSAWPTTTGAPFAWSFRSCFALFLRRQADLPPGPLRTAGPLGAGPSGWPLTEQAIYDLDDPPPVLGRRRTSSRSPFHFHPSTIPTPPWSTSSNAPASSTCRDVVGPGRARGAAGRRGPPP